MPHENMDARQVAAYLHLDLREVLRMASRGKIPARKVAGHWRFRKGDVDHWVEARIHTLDRSRLAGIERGVSAHHGFDHGRLLVWPLVPPGGVAAPLHAKTRESVLRELVGLAEACGRVANRDDLLAEVRGREELCPTGIAPGVAIPHPRHPLPYDVTASFVVVGLAPRGVPYGSLDGGLTRLFLLICCKDDRTHLHVLARVAQMLDEREAVDALLAAKDAEELSRLLRQREAAVASAD